MTSDDGAPGRRADLRPLDSALATSDATSGPAVERPGRRGRWRTVVGRVACLLGGLLVPLVLAELFFRFAGAAAPGDYQTTELTVASDLFERQNLANRAGWKHSPEFSTYVRINSHGLRGPEVPYEKPPGVFRVLVIGDSFTFGAQVDEEQTFVNRLAGYLQHQAAPTELDRSRIQTINGGVDGWSTVNELAWLKAEGQRYAPDLVVLMFYTGNDPGENFDRVKAVRRVTGTVEPEQPSLLRQVRQVLAKYSALYAVVESGVIAKLEAPSEPSEPSDLPDPALIRKRRSIDPDRKDRGWEISGELLRQMRAYTAERGIGLVVVGIPTLENVQNPDRPPTPLGAIGLDAGAPVIDLLDPFRAAAATSPVELYFPKDRHWTAVGHDLAAEVVAGELVRGGFLSPRLARR